MPLWRLYYHLVWATKNREPFIHPDLEDRLYAYIVRKAGALQVHVYAINGWYDHIHLVVAIPPKHAVAYVVKCLKGSSAHYVNQQDIVQLTFGWQRGYGALSVGERQRSIAEEYVVRQKEHHAQQTTLAWLEQFAATDEGPSDLGLSADSGSQTLREAGDSYEIGGESPF
jgi:REP element-mobilizing transposase RayT